MAARHLERAGFAVSGQSLAAAAIGAFLHSLRGGLGIAEVVALGGTALAAALLPARPGLARVGGDWPPKAWPRVSGGRPIPTASSSEEEAPELGRETS